MRKAEETLELIREGSYNTDRPSNLIIKELVEVIELLDRKLYFLNQTNSYPLSEECKCPKPYLIKEENSYGEVIDYCVNCKKPKQR
tara:strand:+ start:275 stop:532 length:258 start_codon:yes stop_codon:yes gene_type:complete